jgi:hypothetical protein
MGQVQQPITYFTGPWDDFMVHGVNNPLVYYEKPHQAIGEMNQTFEGGLFPNYQSIMDERTHHLSHAPIFIHPPNHPIIHPFPLAFSLECSSILDSDFAFGIPFFQ